MIRDITFGQYITGSSALHRLDARLKIVATLAMIVLLFVANNAVGIGASIAFCAVLYAVARIPLKLVFKSLRPIMPIVIFTAAINMFLVPGEPLLEFWKITLSKQGVIYAAVLSLRIICLVAISSLLTYVTSPIELTDAIEKLLSPLKVFKLPVHEFAMMMTIALRFIPTLIDETDKIMNAQKSRGAQLDTGTLKQRIKALVPVLIPLFVSSFMRADDLALAMECRCYRGGQGRTRMKQLRFSFADVVAALLLAAVFVGVTLTNNYFPAVI